MNDFTKEELEKLLMWSVHRAEDIGTVEYCREGSGLLFDKIQSMIDNYCEHDPYGDFHECGDRCRKCGVIVND